MPGSASDYLENALINATLRGAAFPTPSSLYLALFTADPTDANVVANEETGQWYVRQDLAGGGPINSAFTAPSNGVTSNAKVVTFAPVTDAQTTITHYGIYDASSGGNLLIHGPMTTAKTLLIDDVLSFAIGALQIAAT
ncbi:phage tail fiber protein [Marinobacterium iners]|uniref:Uncharacterized protein n=1 Tax=Marinobacterium iners DSM 11526 TaxID=1122198 RepID=A0A1H3X7D2_9GAMM|nr:hypothetical protein [Marinobacterium iners]SDZ94478.1 hypothetical protein SAMN02745729_10143 [Marinobacterium iners DSM 11526]